MAAQHFFIRKNSTIPILKMQIYNDGRNDFKKFFSDIENAAITFSMIDEKGNYKIFNKQALIIPVDKELCQECPEYYIGYKFKPNEVNKAGVYRGEFKIDFFGDGCTLIVPIRDELYINVQDSFTSSRIIC